MPLQLIRRWLFSLALVFSLSLTAPTAQAAFAVCRGDPLLWLSDGTFWRVKVAIAAEPEQIHSVSYTVHVPANVRLVGVVYTGGVLMAKETVRVVADAPSGTYRTDTVVQLWTDAAAWVLTEVDGRRVDGEDWGLAGEVLSITLMP